jgi:hypothetical protein
MTNMLFDFSVKLTDKDGDSVTVDGLYNPLNEIERFLSCTKKEAVGVLDRLKEWDVYAAPCQIILAKNGLIAHNFEVYGQTWWHGHKYNTVNEWDFRSFVENGKTKKKTAAKPCKGILLTCTERQIRKAMQLDYARRIGFDVTRSDYQRFYLL